MSGGEWSPFAAAGIVGGLSPDDPDWTPLQQRSPMEQARWFAFFGPGKGSGGRPERALTRPGENPAFASPMLYMLLQQQEKQAVEDFFAAMRNGKGKADG